MDKTKCYLCENPVYMEMTVNTSFGLITFPTCEKHFAEAEGDIELAVEVMKKAVMNTGRELPVPIEDVPAILEQAGLM